MRTVDSPQVMLSACWVEDMQSDYDALGNLAATSDTVSSYENKHDTAVHHPESDSEAHATDIWLAIDVRPPKTLAQGRGQPEAAARAAADRARAAAGPAAPDFSPGAGRRRGAHARGLPLAVAAGGGHRGGQRAPGGTCGQVPLSSEAAWLCLPIEFRSSFVV